MRLIQPTKNKTEEHDTIRLIRGTGRSRELTDGDYDVSLVGSSYWRNPRMRLLSERKKRMEGKKQYWHWLK
jgi:hypothetical protein